MIITEENKEENLLGGYPVRKTFFKKDEVLHYDKINKQWMAKSIVQVSGMRGSAVFIMATDPTLTEDVETNDIWFKFEVNDTP